MKKTITVFAFIVAIIMIVCSCVTTDNANISRNSRYSSSPSLVVDPSGNPHIAWYDNKYGMLYTHWNCSDWVCADGTVYDPASGNANVSINSDSSSNPSIALDSSGNPHIVWGDGNYIKREIFYTRWNGNDWVCADGTVFDPDLEPNPANISKNSGHSEYSSITLDSSDNLHIVWRCDYDSHRNSEMLYTRWDGTDWVCANGSVYDRDLETNPAIVSRNSGYSYQPSLALDSFGNPHIAWDKYDILYTHWNGSDWVCADGEVYPNFE